MALIRYAAQRFETPRRVFVDGVLTGPENVITVNVPTKRIRLVRNQSVTVTPIISVQTHQTVTIVWVQNTGAVPFRLDVCQRPEEFDCMDLAGQWLAATYLEPDRWLYPGDRRRLYLSSEKPFLTALKELQHVK